MALKTNEGSLRFGDVVDQILKRDGIDTSQVGMATDIVSYINDRVKKAWSHEFWPMTMSIEQKHYHQVYCVGQKYEVGDILWDESQKQYFYCVDETEDFESNDGRYWKAVDETTEWLKIIPYWQNDTLPSDKGSEVIHRIESVSMRNPNRSYSSGLISYELLDYGILVSALAADKVWVKYQKEPPEFTFDTIKNATTYREKIPFGSNAAPASLLYDPNTKNVYKAIAPATVLNPFTDTDYWEVVPFPKFLERYVIHGSYADWLASEGQQAKSIVEHERAEKILYDLMDVYAPSDQVQDTLIYKRG
jgi:hypothetical protein